MFDFFLGDGRDAGEQARRIVQRVRQDVEEQGRSQLPHHEHQVARSVFFMYLNFERSAIKRVFHFAIFFYLSSNVQNTFELELPLCLGTVLRSLRSIEIEEKFRT